MYNIYRFFSVDHFFTYGTVFYYFFYTTKKSRGPYSIFILIQLKCVPILSAPFFVHSSYSKLFVCYSWLPEGKAARAVRVLPHGVHHGAGGGRCLHWQGSHPWYWYEVLFFRVVYPDPASMTVDADSGSRIRIQAQEMKKKMYLYFLFKFFFHFIM
jgi:hypothetical protein